VRVEYFPDDQPAQTTLYIRILDQLSRDAVAHACVECLADPRVLANTLKPLNLGILEKVQSAGDEWGEMAVWRHKTSDHVTTHDWNEQRIGWLNDALVQYYRQPARSLLLDRVFADMLMALKSFELASNHMLTDRSETSKTTVSGQSLANLSLSSLARSLLTASALALIFVTAKWGIEAGRLDPQWVAPLATIVVVFGFLAMPLLIVNRVGKWAEAQQRRNAAQVLAAATNAYTVLADKSATISVAAVQAALDEATARGVSWIGVDLVLNDLRRRGVLELSALDLASPNDGLRQSN
jgi:hypothetical protein